MHGVMMTGDRGVFCDGGVGMFDISMLTSQNLVQCILAISPMYSLSQSLHFTLYTTSHCISFSDMSLGLTNRGPYGFERFVV